MMISRKRLRVKNKKMKRVVNGFMSLIFLCIGLMSCAKVSEYEDESVTPLDKPRIEDTSILKVSLCGNHWYVNMKGELLFGRVFNDCSCFMGGYADVRLGSNYYIIDKKGNFIVNTGNSWCAYDQLCNLIFLFKGDSMGVMDLKGQIIVPQIYSAIIYDKFSDMLMVRLGEETKLYGALDKNGKIVIPVRYEYLYGFRDGISIAELNGKYGIIDKCENEVVPFKYNTYKEIKTIYSQRRKDIISPKKYTSKYEEKKVYPERRFRYMGKWGLLNRDGEKILDYKYSDIIDRNTNLFEIRKDYDKCGVADSEGNIIVPCNYERATVMSDNIIIVEKGEKKGLIDGRGNIILPCIYDEILYDFHFYRDGTREF